jgi:hypothetical protein
MPNNPPPLNSPLPPGGGEKLSIEVIIMSKDNIDFLCSSLWYGYYCDKGIANRENKIDFPCSDAWYDYYYNRGLTTYRGTNKKEDYQIEKVEKQKLRYVAREQLQKESNELKQAISKKFKALERFQ